LNGRELVIGDLGHVKSLQNTTNSILSSSSTQSFGTDNYLAPEAHDRSKRSFKIDIWSFGCIIYELFNLEKLFNSRNPDKLRLSILHFNIENQSNIDKIKNKAPLYVTILKK
jgi:serine/threonine protein kinase